ncbi:MAG: hypothetical protein Hyperionvirus27_31 [Hyperionvirus sp.]|uniref:Uncharacterized protein n=1 Tax=Hyperionvirus sp. TaxID=2487770 RepID=A0A3G5AE10_9VIRU|nr:MAG: hypothetical protein Hyperionvirus27_31 [Hyperionvirus sp.]
MSSEDELNSVTTVISTMIYIAAIMGKIFDGRDTITLSPEFNLL